MIKHTIARIFTTTKVALGRGLSTAPVFRFGGAYEEGMRKIQKVGKEGNRAEEKIHNRSL